jgi:hypothetical protein
VTARAAAIAALALSGVAAGCGGNGSATSAGTTSTSPASGRSAAAFYEQAPAPPARHAAGEAAQTRKERAAVRRRLGTRPDLKVSPRSIVGKEPLDLWFTVTERIDVELGSPVAGDARLARLNRGQRALYMLFEVDGDVQNGGFSQFYFNSGGSFAEDVPAAARAIGADRYARLAEAANRVLMGGRTFAVPREQPPREARLEGLPEEAFARVEDAWSNPPAGEPDLDVLAARYVRAHPHMFLGY